MKITFNELRRIKDSLPDGTMHQLAEELNVEVESVRNYFGGKNFDQGKSMGIYMEEGPDGGIVSIEDASLLNRAKEIIGEEV